MSTIMMILADAVEAHAQTAAEMAAAEVTRILADEFAAAEQTAAAMTRDPVLRRTRPELCGE